MWQLSEITLELTMVEGTEAIVAITTPVGVMQLLGTITVRGRVLHIDGAHVDGLTPGALGRSGLHAIGRKLLVEADVDEIVIQGGTRTTGKCKGKKPKPIRFPH